ncbi:MAG: four helix bundle protein [Candidatus Moranbacteria bacterium RBG_13_45_13]|nr:MAG: four helix bundle protein [Candidatus Moranbacteria bacterium RBG_13_45_13]
MRKKSEKYNLEARTTKFSEDIIVFARKIKKDIVNNPIIIQLVKSATSIGANYCEAHGACSKRDFKNKIYICKKEAKETKYWLQLIAKANPEHKEECRKYWKEAHELTLIFSKTILTLEKNK